MIGMKRLSTTWLRLLLLLAWMTEFSGTLVAQNATSSTVEKDGEGGGPADPDSIEALMRKVRPSLVTVLQVGRDGGDRGIGAGFVVAEDGLIVTNLHVTGEGRRIRVRLVDGSEPKVIAMHAWDRKFDLAVLRVDADGLQPLELADSDDVRQGVETLALGNPEGLEFSVTRGVISGLRDVNGVDMIQAAVPIERGNSGGPLMDRFGKVLGVITLKSALTENLGFAMPVGNVRGLLEKPNTMPMEYWQRIGRLNPRLWQAPGGPGGPSWRQNTGTISVQGVGAGFGGRALCLSTIEPPELPYEIAVEVKLDDETGAGGIAFASDGGDRHYGFYPTAGQLRLTRFDGPTVYSWNILAQTSSEHYRAGDWNHLRVRVEQERILCYVNDQLVIESDDGAWRNGSAGLCKFRQTEPLFRRFEFGEDFSTTHEVPAEFSTAVQLFSSGTSAGDALLTELEAIDSSARAERFVLGTAVRELRKRADELEAVAARLHRQRVTKAVLKELAADEPDIDLLRATLLISYLDSPKLIISDYLSEFDRMAAELEENIAVAAISPGGEIRKLSERQRLELLGLYLFEQNGFHGSRSDYYHQSNSYLNEVLDDREGLPITLSIVYMELGRRLGLQLDGIPLPGHFVVRHQPVRAGAPPQMVDVFDGGTFISEAEAADLVLANAGMALMPEHLKPAVKRDIILRVLRNLTGVAIDSEEAPRALPYLDLILAIAPDASQERLSRAILSYQSGFSDQAKIDIDWLIDHRPRGGRNRSTARVARIPRKVTRRTEQRMPRGCDSPKNQILITLALRPAPITLFLPASRDRCFLLSLTRWKKLYFRL